MSETESQLLTSLAGGILRVTFNRPAAANAITAEMREALIAALTSAAEDHAVRVVVIAANGKHFCSGADVGNIKAQVHAGDSMLRVMRGAQRVVSAIFNCPKPVIAAVQGTAAGLGAHVAFASDLVVAATEASFIEVFVKRGICVDAGGAWLLPRLVGLQKAKELVYFGDRISGDEAKSLGLVNRVVPGAELESTTSALAQRLAAGPTLAISLSKRLLNAAFEADSTSALVAEAMAQEVTSRSEDAAEGIQSFYERREPQFKGY